MIIWVHCDSIKNEAESFDIKWISWPKLCYLCCPRDMIDTSKCEIVYFLLARQFIHYIRRNRYDRNCMAIVLCVCWKVFALISNKINHKNDFFVCVYHVCVYHVMENKKSRNTVFSYFCKPNRYFFISIKLVNIYLSFICVYTRIMLQNTKILAS